MSCVLKENYTVIKPLDNISLVRAVCIKQWLDRSLAFSKRTSDITHFYHVAIGQHSALVTHLEKNQTELQPCDFYVSLRKVT